MYNAGKMLPEKNVEIASAEPTVGEDQHFASLLVVPTPCFWQDGGPLKFLWCTVMALIGGKDV